MTKLLHAAALAAALMAAAAPALADITVPTSNGTVTTCAKVLPGGLQVPCHVHLGSDGVEKDTPGNPSYMAVVAGPGALALVPAGTTNGAALGALPAGATGVRFYLGTGDSVTFTVAGSAPSSAPAVTFQISGAAGGTGPNWDENLAAGAMVYVTQITGAPKFRWY